MVLHPEVQRRAQEELDRIVGRDTLPDFSHRQHLPYVEAVAKEVLRWLPVTPSSKTNYYSLLLPTERYSGNPHLLMEDDEYNGYYFPKGSIVFGGSW